MKRPADQAKLLLFALLRSSATALATTGEKAAAASPRVLYPLTTTNTAALPANLNIQLRLATRTDVPSIQRCNLACLPENYNAQFYGSHLRQWPDLALVAEHVEHSPASGTTAPNSSSSSSNMGFPFGAFSPGSHYHKHPTTNSNGGGGEPKIVAYVLGKVEHRPVVDYNQSPNDANNNNNNNMETLGHVTSLAVRHEYRRLGLGRELMTQLHHHLLHQSHADVTSCGLHVRRSNEAACQLYQRGGYEIVQVIPRYYQDGEDAYFMKKTLHHDASSSSSSSTSTTRRGGGGFFFGKQIWKCGPEALRLPRRHVLPVQETETTIAAATADTMMATTNHTTANGLVEANAMPPPPSSTTTTTTTEESELYYLDSMNTEGERGLFGTNRSYQQWKQ